MTATGALAGVYPIVLLYGIKLAHEGRDRPLLALAVRVVPWVGVMLGIVLVATPWVSVRSILNAAL